MLTYFDIYKAVSSIVEVEADCSVKDDKLSIDINLEIDLPDFITDMFKDDTSTDK